VSDGSSTTALIEPWLQPLAGDAGACGADLEYDNDFLALTQAAAGKPETQFEAAVPPDWRSVRSQAEALLQRTRDLRVAIIWLRAALHLDGLGVLPAGLHLLHGLLDNFWDTLHPQPDPDDGDPYARMNALGDLRESTVVLADLRQCLVCSVRGIGEIRVRHVEVALGQAVARDNEPAMGREQLAQVLLAAEGQQPGLLALPGQALGELKALTALVNDRAGVANAPDFKPLQAVLYALSTAVPTAPEAAATASVGAEADAPLALAMGAAGTPRGLSGGVHSREDALRAIDMVCEFLERTEPTNPAQLMLRRARRLVTQNFLQLMKELAPDALAEVARVMGVDPESVQLDP